ncbi:MAG: hypothetical protein COY40_04170 [Alphaproteobacteria bacterium CG_4_10_14_0_8_um_filter_53_9]|nr:MAG: hypothetical protein COY40_04170 [Alphaproteobacteria bacterium CG_4_10_14_0_8_um_filter_53_9]
MKLSWNPKQAEALSHRGSQLIIGPPGSGKTAMLVHLAEEALKKHGKGKVGWAAFSFRGLAALTQNYPHLAENLVHATMVEHAQNQLQAAGKEVKFCSNNNTRRILRTLMSAQGFTGTLHEAEHLIKNFKSRAKKVPESEAYYPFFQAYQKQLEQRGLSDRHDVLRNHLLAMRGGEAEPLPVKVLVLDNVQDATEIQLLWIRTHIGAGTTVLMAGDDDLTAFGRDGALGGKALEQIRDWPEVVTHSLSDTYRIPANLTGPITKVARMLKSRLDKTVTPHNKTHAEFAIHAFSTAEEEIAWLIDTAKKAATGKNAHVGIITRDDMSAHIMAHHMRRAGFPTGEYTRPLWDEPAAATVLSLLYLMLGHADEKHVRTALTGFGVPYATVKELEAGGLEITDWLKNGAPWPGVTTLTPATRAQLNHLGRQLVESYELFNGKKLNPRMVFKALVHDMLTHLPQAEHPYAILATEKLLSISGKLTEILPRLTEEMMPDTTSPIIIAPVREVRNQQFTTLFLPFFHQGKWPKTHYPVLGEDKEHERHLLYLALTRTGGDVHISHHHIPSSYIAELETALSSEAKRQQKAKK